MTTRKPFVTLLVILALALAAPPSPAQEKQAQPPQKDRDTRTVAPYAPLGPEESSSASGGNEAPAAAEATRPLRPDQRPLSGIERYTLESLGASRSYLTTAVSFSGVGQTNPDRLPGTSYFTASGYLQGSLVAQRIWGRQRLTANYGGGTSFNQDQRFTSGLGQHHQFGLSHSIQFRRWDLQLANYLTLLPESAFGYFGLQTLGFGFGQFGQGFVPDLSHIPSDSIINGQSRRLANSTMAEVHVLLSPRSTLTVNGSYSLLHFSDAGFLDSRSQAMGLGYSYRLNQSDSVIVSYRHSRFSFGNGSQKADSNAVHVGYGRFVTRRMRLSLSAGPDLQHFSSTTGVPESRRLTWSARTALDYAFRRGGVTIAYSHYLSGGSGVLAGARTHFVDANYWYQISQKWVGRLAAGYSRNASATDPASSNRFRGVTGGVTLERPLGRYASLALNYNVYYQQSALPFCIDGRCGLSNTRHAVGATLRFGSPPLALD